jgi:hypothetical protein
MNGLGEYLSGGNDGPGGRDTQGTQGALPCPECRQRAGWEPMGPYRSLCQGCGALVKNDEAYGR